MTTFSKDTLALLDQVNQVYPGSVILRTAGEASGVIRHDQVKTDVLGTRLMIEVTDLTAPDYSATHELLHMMLTLNGYPQVYFQLEAPEQELTEQMMVMATYLYQPAMHAIIYREQAAHGLLTTDVAEAYAKGVMTTLTSDQDGEDSEAALRLLTLFDAKIFMLNYPGDASVWTDTFAERFPKAWAAAELLAEQVTPAKIKDPASMHRAIVAAFKGFDAQMLAWNLPELYNNEFTTLTPVLSEHQLRLTVSHVFDIKHAEFKNHATVDDAYVGLGKSDGQNSFVLTPPADADPEWFKQLYQSNVRELLDNLHQPYTVRQ